MLWELELQFGILWYTPSIATSPLLSTRQKSITCFFNHSALVLPGVASPLIIVTMPLRCGYKSNGKVTAS